MKCYNILLFPFNHCIETNAFFNNTYPNRQVTEQWCIVLLPGKTLRQSSGTWIEPLPPSTSLLLGWSTGSTLTLSHNLQSVQSFQSQSQIPAACQWGHNTAVYGIWRHPCVESFYFENYEVNTLNQWKCTHFMHKSVMTVATRPSRDSDVPIVDMISVSWSRGCDVLCGAILSDMSYNKASIVASRMHLT